MQAVCERCREYCAVGGEGRFEGCNTVTFKSEMYNEFCKVFVCHANVILELNADLRGQSEERRMGGRRCW